MKLALETAGRRRELNQRMATRGAIFLVVRNPVIRSDLYETLMEAGFHVEVFDLHERALAALKNGAPPRSALFDTPFDDAPAARLEQELSKRGIPFLRLASNDNGSLVPGTEEAVIEYPFASSQIIASLTRQLG